MPYFGTGRRTHPLLHSSKIQPQNSSQTFIACFPLQDFKHSARLVSDFLECYLQRYQEPQQQVTGIDPRTNILRCLMSWVTLGSFPMATIHDNPVVHFAFA